MNLDREVEIDIASAAEVLPFVDGTYVLELTDRARAHPDALSFAIVLSPYGVRELVETHYAVLAATGTHRLTGRILYVDGSQPAPRPLHHARRVALTDEQRSRARERRAQRKPEETPTSGVREQLRESLEDGLARVEQLNRELRDLLNDASRFLAEWPSSDEVSSPYRAFGGPAITATLAPGPVLVEVVSDPFGGGLRRRVLVVDDDVGAVDGLRRLADVDVIHAPDGWTALDRMSQGEFDLILCAVVLGDFTGAKFHRMVAKAHPEMASRIVFVAEQNVIASAPPSSANKRVLARPINAAVVLTLLKRMER